MVYSGDTRATNQFPLCPGDVILTSSSNTGLLGLTGHAGIAVSTTEILHITGKNQGDNTLKISTLVAWIDSFGDGYTDIYRCNDSSIGQAAANEALRLYHPKTGLYKDVTYQITMPI